MRDVAPSCWSSWPFANELGLPVDDLLRSQRDRFAPLIESLTVHAESGDTVARWRVENARAVRRFLDGELHASSRPGLQRPPTTLRLSARNQLSATVERITHGDVMLAVHTRLPDGQRLTSVVTNDALGDLDVTEGDAVLVVVKSTEAMLAKG